MATVQFSPVGNAAQFFNANGQPLNAGTLNTYAAGTSTPVATYTDATGSVANANPITLGVDGRPPQEIWLAASTGYKFVLSDSLGNVIAAWDNIQGIPATVASRGYIAGLTMSTAGGSASMTIAAGQATDSVNTVAMSLAAAITKNTGLWALGTNAGGLDSGSIANSTWYHFFLIYRSDTGATDVIFSTSPSSPALPANYTNLRRIGSGKTDGSAHWTGFVQNGDFFEWTTSVQDINATNSGAVSRVTQTLTVPPGVVVRAVLSAQIATSTFTAGAGLPWTVSVRVSNLAATDETPAGSNCQLGQAGGDGTTLKTPNVKGWVQVVTNTSAQIGWRISLTDGATSFSAATNGWFDSRGRDS